MNLDLGYYLAIFWRRLPLFLAVAGLIGGAAIYAAMTLPPSYVSQAQLIIENSQIPDSMAGPSVSVPPEEQLELFQARLLTRGNMLAIARKIEVFENQAAMTADEIVREMQLSTRIRRQAGRNRATAMTISFEARSGRIAAAVLNEYLDLILAQDASNRTERASQTQEFFKQEVDRLSQQLDQVSVRILEFKKANPDALPDSLDYRRNQQLALQERIAQAERDVTALRDQRQKLIDLFATTGRVDSVQNANRSPEELQLDGLKKQLNEALLVYSTENPQVKLLQRRIAQLEQIVTEQAGAAPDAAGAPVDPAKAMLDLQVAEIDGRIAALLAQLDSDRAKLEALNDSISRTPANALALEAMERDFENLKSQYNTAVARLAQASTGERIELLSRGEKVSIIEQPSVPTTPSKPDRTKLAAMGVALGLGAGAGLIVLLELLNSTARRPADLVARLGMAPIATIPYLQTRRERVARRLSQTAMVLLVLVAIPAALMAVHVYYQPLDLLVDRLMSRFGMRG